MKVDVTYEVNVPDKMTKEEIAEYLKTFGTGRLVNWKEAK